MDENKGILSESNFQGLSLVLMGLILVGVIFILAIQLNTFDVPRRPQVLNFPEPTRDPVYKDTINMSSYLTPQSRHHGKVINFSNWGLPGNQPSLRPRPNEKKWQGYRTS